MSEKIMLIDGHSIINRAFYGLPILTNSQGEYTNAVLGFLNIFFRLYEEEKPDYVVVAFDLSTPTFRHIKFEEYKGTRKSMPEELRPQVPLLKNLLQMMNIKTVELEGFEADDLLGTLATKAQSKNLDAVIVSGDKDMLQVATDKIKIRIPKTRLGKTDIEDYYAADIIEKMGVTPTEFIDVKALMGDASDNIPGVPGIGEKTAYKIITEYKNIESAIEHAADIKPKKASENLVTFKEQAILSKMLATIELNAPIEADFLNWTAKDMFTQSAYHEYQRLGFRSLLNKFKINDFVETLDEASVEDNLAKNLVGTVIQEEKELIAFLPVLLSKQICAYTPVYKNGVLLGISFSFEKNQSTFIAINKNLLEEKMFTLLKPFFEGSVKKVALDAKANIHLLDKYSIEMKNLDFDVMIGAYILNSSKEKYEYNDIAYDFLNENYDSVETIFSKTKGVQQLSFIEQSQEENDETIDETIINYAYRISDVIFRVCDLMKKKIIENEQQFLYYEIELPLIFVLADMEKLGIK